MVVLWMEFSLVVTTELEYQGRVVASKMPGWHPGKWATL